MKNKELMKQMSDSLFEICLENHISLLTKVTIKIDLDMKVNEKDLFMFLLDDIGFVIGLETKIIIKKEEYTKNIFIIELIEGLDRYKSKIIIKNK
ncbi:MAG: hypothetical protein K0Q49_1475 [Haloplasmataceae bacterium]|jgi:hypothetical protein|nr:hypothetical protein [Haloplasmataceae bacterium]